MTVILVGILASMAAYLGGLTAVKNRHRLDLTLGFTAGLILGLVVFDLLPEIFHTAATESFDSIYPMIAFAVGFLFFHIIEKSILIHSSHEDEYGTHSHPYVGIIGASALSIHSFLDGASIGLAFQISSSIGLAVSVAVIGHRFADGFNTANLMIVHKNKERLARNLVKAASIMPMVGIITTQFISLSSKVLVVYLGFFAGFLMYLGASDILPQAHSKSSSKKTIAMTILGTLLMFGISRWAV